MKNRVLLAFLLICAAALAGCGDPAATAPKESSPAPSVSAGVPFDCQDANYKESVRAEPMECKRFTSIAGSAPGQDLSWLTSTPLHMTFSRMNGSLTMLLRMPCGVMNIPVSVTSDAITPDLAGIIESADGCTGPSGKHRTWTTTYVKTRLTYSLGEDSLLLTGDLGQIHFKRS